MATNTNVRTRGVQNRVLVFAPDADVLDAIQQGLDGVPFVITIAATVPAIVRALVHAGPARPQLLIADLDVMSAADVMALHEIRSGGWFGSLIAIGVVSEELRKSLNIERVLALPLRVAAVRDAVAQVGLDRATTRIRKLER